MPFSYEPEYDYTHTRISRTKSQDIVLEKSLTLGGLNESYDPDARDGDGDGTVQEGTAFERPATPSTRDVSTIGSMPSAVGSSTTGATTGDDAPPYGIPRPRIPVEKPRPVIAMDKPRPRIPLLDKIRSRPPISGKHRDTYGHPLRLAGLTPSEIAARVVPRSFNDHVKMLVESRIGSYEMFCRRNQLNPSDSLSKKVFAKAVKEHTKSMSNYMKEFRDKALKLRKDYEDGVIDTEQFLDRFRDPRMALFDYSKDGVDKTRALVIRTLSESPVMKWTVERYGMPPIVMDKKYKVKNGMIAMPSYSGYHDPLLHTICINQQNYDRNLFKPAEKLQTPNAQGINHLVDPTNNGVLRHEYGHYFAHVLETHGDTLFDDRPDMDMFKDAKLREAGWTVGRSSNKPEAVGLYDAVTSNLPYVQSMYGQQSYSEMFAEGFAAYSHPDQNKAHLMSPTLESMIDAMLGVDKKDRPWSGPIPGNIVGSNIGSKPSLSKIEPTELSIMDWDRPAKHKVSTNEFGERVHRFTLGDFSFDWVDELDPTDEDYPEKAAKAVMEHFDTSSFNGSVRHEGDAWFNRQVSALLFGYQVAPADFMHYGRRGNWDKEANPEFDAILTGDVAKYDEYDRESIQFALERAMRVMQTVSDSDQNSETKWRLVKDPEGMAVGDVIPIPLTNVANRVDDIRIPSRDEDHFVMSGEVGKGSAIMKIVGPHYSAGNDTESLIQGNFRIKRIYVNDMGNKVVEMEQIDTYSPRDNAFRTVATQGQIAMRELGSAYPINIPVEDTE